jgi:hypothetical protein
MRTRLGRASRCDAWPGKDGRGKARSSTNKEEKMDVLLTLLAILLLIVVPAVAGMAIGFGMRDDHGHH